MFSVITSKEYPYKNLRGILRENIKNAVSKGFDSLADEHIKKWERRWHDKNIEIKGDGLCDRALRFNIYHLLSANSEYNMLGSIGARALTGQGYRGHVFWDSEVFMLPFYAQTEPELARRMIKYRYDRLDGARKAARQRNLKGALFPWESGTEDRDVTGKYAKDADGSYMLMDTMEYEQHISADTAYGVYTYWSNTGDLETMFKYGLEIIFETARFWGSRAEYNERKEIFEIRHVTGPDEFHPNVDNNAYTNEMAAWNLEYAYSIYYEFNDKYPEKVSETARKIKLSKSEVDSWKDVFESMYIPESKKTGVIEQFDGYFQKPHMNIKSYNRHFMPEVPKLKSYADFANYQFIKQADVLLVLYLRDKFSREQVEKNYKFYINRTLHQSSLSHSIHALLAAKSGDRCRAYAFFLYASEADLKNRHNNTDGGMHMANAGGVWLSAVNGFAGIKLTGGEIKIYPRLPGNWKSMSLSLKWQSGILRFEIMHTKVKISYYPQDKAGNRILEIAGDKYVIEPGKTVAVKLKEEKMKTVKDVMRTKNLIVAGAATPLKHVCRLFARNEVNIVPVVGENSEFIGFVSQKDVHCEVEKEKEETKAGEIVRDASLKLKSDDAIEAAIQKFGESLVNILPVIEKGKLAGVVMRQDLVSMLSECKEMPSLEEMKTV